MKYSTIVLAALFSSTTSAITFKKGGEPLQTGTVPKAKTFTDEDCKGFKETDLYKPYVYKGHCMNPPLYPNVEACPVDKEKKLANGITKAIPYP